MDIVFERCAVMSRFKNWHQKYIPLNIEWTMCLEFVNRTKLNSQHTCMCWDVYDRSIRMRVLNLTNDMNKKKLLKSRENSYRHLFLITLDACSK